MQWDVFCRVIDNHGDLGVCWRLASDLASRGQRVRLWVDDPSALRWMAPDGAARRSVQVMTWPEGHGVGTDPPASPGEVVVEAFGCNPPASFVTRMADQAADGRPPVWINLEYLTAEAWAERAHGLPSPQMAGPGRGLTKWFWFPGFTGASGGLLREPGLLQARQDFGPAAVAAFLRELGVPADGAAPVSVFCYPHAPLDALVATLARQAAPGSGAPRWRLLVAPGVPLPRAAPAVQVQRLPWLSQPDYDRLLWCCALNVVRGEDSFVRAQWAARPFLWHIYPQDDGAHGPKLDAFLHRFGADAVPGLAACWRAFNGLDLPTTVTTKTTLPWPDPGPWAQACTRWSAAQAGLADLVSGLLAFVAARRSAQSTG